MSVLARLTRHAFRYRRRFLLAYASTFGATAVSLIIPRLLGDAIDTVITSGVRINLLWMALAIVGVSIVRGFLTYGQGYLGEWVSQRVAYDLRNSFYEKLQRLSFAYHDQQQTGNLMSKATSDIEGVRWFIYLGLLRGAYLGVLFIGVAVLLLTMHWQLGLLSLAFVPIAIWRAIMASRKLRKLWTGVQTSLGELITLLQENLTGARLVRGFGAQDYEQEKFHGKASEVSDLSYQASRVDASITSLLNLVFTLATLLIVWYGGRQVLQGDITAGQLSQFIFYMGMLILPVRSTGRLVNTFARAASAGQRIFDVLDAESPVKEAPEAVTVDRLQGDVSFEDVSLSYNGRSPALRGVTLEAKPGQVVALLGPPGSGKSSLIHLVPRFYDTSGGSVTIDGLDIRDLTLESLRRNVGIVLQDVFLFTATIRDNIAYGAPEATQEDVERVAQIAQFHDFVVSLPEGYDTWVGERGVTLSGGQRQRLAIARTLLINPPILILDDSTSSIDAQTEYQIQQAMEEVIRGRTTFVIAHRLSTVKAADLVIVMERGLVVERGTHEELLALDGLYTRIYELQLRPQDVDAPVSSEGPLSGADQRGQR
ncbi:MAG: ATP-binding cassette, subfamily B [Chloroflexi bacterium]|jgi:ATP-binding cassette subfamily B protein|nr:MAG: ATP-binding cassette, subfamily B [Chloroflexota bacterium]